jgi:hypothetical protein
MIGNRETAMPKLAYFGGAQALRRWMVRRLSPLCEHIPKAGKHAYCPRSEGILRLAETHSLPRGHG